MGGSFLSCQDLLQCHSFTEEPPAIPNPLSPAPSQLRLDLRVGPGSPAHFRSGIWTSGDPQHPVSDSWRTEGASGLRAPVFPAGNRAAARGGSCVPRSGGGPSPHRHPAVPGTRSPRAGRHRPRETRGRHREGGGSSSREAPKGAPLRREGTAGCGAQACCPGCGGGGGRTGEPRSLCLGGGVPAAGTLEPGGLHL